MKMPFILLLLVAPLTSLAAEPATRPKIVLVMPGKRKNRRRRHHETDPRNRPHPLRLRASARDKSSRRIEAECHPWMASSPFAK